MADEQSVKKCKNPTCDCRITERDADYCSANCEGAGDVTQIDCDCGHKECSGDF